MDEHRFDRLARTVGSHRTRREALRWLGGSIVALITLMRGRNAAAQAAVQLGGACYDSGQCRDDGFGPMYCDANGYDYDGPLNCCRYEGGFCGEFHENCCGDLECWNGGYCTRVSGTRGVGITGDTGASYSPGPGDPCWNDDQCRAAGYYLCDDNGVYSDGSLHCCAPVRGHCIYHDHCCGTALCLDGICENL